MTMRRIQGFEFNDAPSMPLVLRESIVETLSRGLEWGGILNGLAEPFAAFLRTAEVSEVLDLCSGAGKPVRILARSLLHAQAKPPRFTLTDLMPHTEAWTAIRQELPEVVQFVPTPVDATAIDPALSARRARLMVNALHHFPPPLVGAIFGDAVRSGAPIFIAECFERGPFNFTPMLPYLFLAHLANPLLAPRHKLLKALLAWMTPIGAVVGVWDGLISALRVYSEAELRGLVAPFGAGYDWSYGNFAFNLGGRGYFFQGIPRQPVALP